MDRLEIESRVVAHVNGAQYRPVKLKVIAKQLGITEEDRRSLRVAVRKLARRGTIIYAANHVIHPVVPGVATSTPSANPKAKPTAKPTAAAIKTISGTFRRSASGKGFVRPSSNRRPIDRSKDILIPANQCKDAADGDRVAVLLSRRQRQGQERLTGEVVEILERDTHRFVGTFSPDQGVAYVQVDGRLFAQPIYVGDAESTGAQPGDKVVIEMVRFPSHVHEGEAVVVEVLGARGSPGVDTLSIMREFDLPERFPDEVVAFARSVADAFDETNLEHRADFTQVPTITIDPKDARDFDDAISLETLENGHWLLTVHIADVAHFVPARSVLDTEARERATSVYLPDRVIPMLPEIISNHLASLQPGKVRLTKSVRIEFTPDGVRVSAEPVNAAIRSDRRFTYEEVDSYLAVPESWRAKLSPAVFALVGKMHTLAMLLRRRRLERGAIELTLPEVKIDLDSKGRVSGAHLVENTESHQMIEEFMLAANEAVADFLQQKEIDFLRRIHDQPDPRKLQALTDFVHDLGFETSGMHDRFEVKRVVALVSDRPERHAINYAVLRSMAKAIYSPEVQGHYALHSPNYCHFTSPIRRYPDLTIHRSIDAVLRHRRPSGDLQALVLLGDHCSEREQRAESAERELIKVKLLGYLAKRVGESLEAVVTGVERFGVFAQGVQIPAEGRISIETLRDDHYRYDDRGHCLVGHRSGNTIRLGDHIRVEVLRVDVDRRELDLRFVERLSQSPKLPKTKRQKIEERTKRRPKRDSSAKKARGQRRRSK